MLYYCLKKISNGVFVTFHYDLGSFSFNTNIEIAQTLEIYSHENNQEIKVWTIPLKQIEIKNKGWQKLMEQ